MGLGPPVIELYRQLKLTGAFDGIAEVMELGSQDFWCPQQNLVKALCRAFDRQNPPSELLATNNTNQLPARRLYEALGLEYHCVDVDGRVGTLVMDLNFDGAPPEHLSRYGLVTNHGTSEHLINQYNVFKIMHDFTKPGGLMIHAVPFTVHLEHGFFNYQPNFFEALARYNSYETLGIWVGPDWQLASFVPWDPALLDFLSLSAKTTHLLVVAQRKMYEQPFCVPFQEVYENMVPDEALNRYAMVIDGEIMDATRVKYLTKDAILAKEYLTEIQGLKNWIDAYRGEIDGLKHELSVTKHILNEATHGAPPPNPWTARITELEQQLAGFKAASEQVSAQQAELVAGFKAASDQVAAQQAELVEHQVNFNATCERLGEQLDAKNNELAAHQAALAELSQQLAEARQLMGIGGRQLLGELSRRVRRRVIPNFRQFVARSMTAAEPRMRDLPREDAALRERIRQLEEEVAELNEAATERERGTAVEIAAYQAAYTERVGYLEAQVAALTEAAIARETQATGQVAALTEAAVARETQATAQVAALTEAAVARETQATAQVAALTEAAVAGEDQLKAQIAALTAAAVERERQTQEMDYQLLMIHQNLLAEFKDIETEFVTLYERCKPFTMTSLERLYSLFKCVEYVSEAGIGGDLAECGVWRGGSCMLMALGLLRASDTGRHIYMYDTFEGHPPPDPEKDIDLWGNHGIDEYLRQTEAGTLRAWGAASLAEVRTNLLSTGYPMERLTFIKGMMETTVPENVPERLALLRLDSDWYESTLVALRHLYPRLAEGGVLIIDDYGHYRGQRQAVDEYFAEMGGKLLLHRIDYSCRVMVKRSNSV